MKRFFSAFLLSTALLTTAADAQQDAPEASMPWLNLPGVASHLPEGVDKPPKVVLISGDDEYRSEEALPLLAQILADQHGIDCTVLFSINPETNSVDPNYHFNNPGLENLDDADAMILFTRFRSWPDDQMKHFEKYVLSGKPIIAMRTATHPFDFPPDVETSYRHWSWNNKDQQFAGGFGQQILGETWYTHHGKHKKESARAVIDSSNADHPILRGIDDLWAAADVYGVVHLPETAQILLRGQVLTGMNPTDPPVDDGRNDPMMPMAWVKDYQLDGGDQGQAFVTTLGSSVDLQNEDLRRLVVNATYWALGWEDKITPSLPVELPGLYEPHFFGFQPGDFFSEQHKQPSDYLVK